MKSAVRAELRGSALALLVARVFADDAHDAFSADDLALVADLFDAGTDFHGRLLSSLLVAVGDPPAAQVVGAHFDRHSIARKDPDVELTHPPADGGEDDEA